MILQQLENDYEHILGFGVVQDAEDDTEEIAPPSMYQVKPVRWLVVIDRDGEFRFQLLQGDRPKNDPGMPMPVPVVPRTVNISPFLLADTPAYVLGVGEDKRSGEKHEAFRDLVGRCAEATANPQVQAVVQFLEEWNRSDEHPSLPDKMNPGDLITFQVGSDRAIDDAKVRSFWADLCSENSKTSAQNMQCLICGRLRPAVEIMPVAVKGIPGGQPTGTSLVSVNSDVYESYGLKRATTSPICASCAERFGKSLNALLKNPDTHKRIGNWVYVFWTQAGPSEAVRQLGDPQPEYVKALIESAGKGKQYVLKRTEAFYGISLSATVARAVVRDWLSTTIGHVERNVARWFLMQRIPDEAGQMGRSLPDWKLAASLYRKKENNRLNSQAVEARVADAMIRTALSGTPLPTDLLHLAVLRNRAERDVSYERAALMTLIFRSQRELQTYTEEEELLTTELQGPALTTPDPADEQAMRCGRLLALLDEVQTAFVKADNPTRSIKATLVDRFYGAASSAPATVFGTLLSDAQAHLTKLRKTQPATWYALQEKLEIVLGDMQDFPRTLNMRRQALFSLGYYHQRAEFRAARTAGWEAKRARLDKENGDQMETATETLELFENEGGE